MHTVVHEPYNIHTKQEGAIIYNFLTKLTDTDSPSSEGSLSNSGARDGSASPHIGGGRYSEREGSCGQNRRHCRLRENRKGGIITQAHKFKYKY